MARAYSEDLRRRVMVAIAGGLSTRAAARRFEIGESTAGAWHRLWRASGDCRARKQGPFFRHSLAGGSNDCSALGSQRLPETIKICTGKPVSFLLCGKLAALPKDRKLGSIQRAGALMLRDHKCVLFP